MKNLTFGIAAGGLLLATGTAVAQRSSHVKRASRCDTIATTSITFGRTGGNITPAGLRIAASGAVTSLADRAGVGSSARAVPVDELRRLAALGWRGRFVRLPTAPTRPTHNPDVARDFVELRSACARKHVEVPADQEPAAFRALFTQLETVAGKPY
jgi:hypothetical protein